ncbi:MAG: phosphoglycerate kinase [Gammaproteobacteria bacterium]|nr:MAG: phosphoglycerate kinase [Pseudomonadota bacterium]PIE37997.1 MAG: phosphoglycerate kinase [Gammaproteobacteria bacterium]
MSSIYLVRHGQASFGKADYDQLSPKGFSQSATLFEHFRHLNPTHLYRGAMLRHEQTGQAYCDSAGLQMTMRCDTGFNEFDHVDVLNCYKPAWKDRTQMAAEIGNEAHPGRYFQQQFTLAVKRWVAGDHDGDYAETWNAFKTRVETAFLSLVARLPGGSNAIVFTSGGPISVICGHILGLGVEQTLSLNENIANASVTRVLSNKDKLSLHYFNNYSHLQSGGEQLLTYR